MTKKSSSKTLFYTMVLAFVILTTYANAGEVPSFSIGGFGGFVHSMSTGGVKENQDTEWETGSAFGGSIMYRLTNGLMLELLFEQFEMGLEEKGNKIGTIKATPVLIMIGYQGFPKKQKGLAFHATIGGGIASSDFEKGDLVKDLENTSGGNIDISTDSAFMFEIGAGMDYFFTKNIALTLDGRVLTGVIDSEWDYTNGDKENFLFLTSNFQGLVGIRFWF